MEHSSEAYYVPAQSYWPIIGAVGLFSLMGGGALTLHSMQQGQISLISQIAVYSGVLIMTGMLFGWFAAVISETKQGLYSPQLDISFRLGMSWFIFTDVMFFFAFFGALFFTPISYFAQNIGHLKFRREFLLIEPSTSIATN